MEQVPVSLLTLLAGIVITIISIWIGQHHHLLPVQASQQAPLVDDFFNVMFTIAIALFLIVEGAILVFAYVYRRRRGDDSDGVPIEGNFALEVFWTAVPSIIVIGLGIYSVDVFTQMGGFGAGSHHMMSQATNSPSYHVMSQAAVAATLDDDATPVVKKTKAKEANIGLGGNSGKPADLTVDVTGMQFAWLFNYAQDEITTGELHVPIGADVQVNLAASDVIHSFWVPQFRIKQDAIPGQATQLRFVATKTGTYPIVCAELCGGYHGAMRSRVIVHTPEEYQGWLLANRPVVEPPPQLPEEIEEEIPAEIEEQIQPEIESELAETFLGAVPSKNSFQENEELPG
jgi:cytochrome c oxidase subunit II